MDGGGPAYAAVHVAPRRGGRYRHDVDASVSPEGLPEHRPAQLRASHADRERVAELLRDAAGDGRLDIGELEERLEQAYAAKTYGELEPLFHDLPTTAPSPPAPPSSTSSRGLQRWVPASPAAQRIGGDPTSSTAVAIFGAAERKGQWVVPTSFTATAIFGGIDLDLREARFASRVVEIQAVAVFGGIDIVVPPDVEVVVEGTGIMGGFSRPKEQPEVPEGSPVVRVTGLALFGGVDVKVKAPKQRKQLDAGS